jgi:Fungal specific transcription factor domain/Fungal Zn(2)-Cys(6) binuclear cluster domain
MTDSNNDDFTSGNSLKRPRPVISCLDCRRKKLKCDRNLPCQQCVKGGRAASCSFQPGQEPDVRAAGPDQPEKRRRTDSLADVNGLPRTDGNSLPLIVGPSSSAPRPIPHPPTGTGLFEQLEQRVAKLENIVNTTHPESSHKLNHGRGSQTPLPWNPPVPAQPRQSMHTNVFPFATKFLQAWLNSEGECGARAKKAAAELRQLHESLKRFHQDPLADQSAQYLPDVINLVPSRSTCQILVELYFDNLEHCFRVLHRPTFDRQLNDFFSANAMEQDPNFLPQLVGVLAIASILGIRNECFDVAGNSCRTLIHSSEKIIHNHLNKLTTRQIHTIPALQTRMVFLLLRWMRLDKLGDIWELSGQILRQALAMRLDADPDESAIQYTVFEAEMRRRLWMTVCEQEVMLSILCNMPCMVPDSTCKAPLNVDDVELEQDSMPASRPFDEWTDALCQVYLAQSIKQRLHGCRDMQAVSQDSYKHVLEHTRSFERYLQDLPAPLRFNHLGDSASKAPARLMARMELDITMRRPLLQLYSPFCYANDEADVFSEARAGYLQSCLVITAYQDLFDPKYSEIGVERPGGYWDFFYNVYRYELNQATLGMCLEIQRLSSSSQPNHPVANHTFTAFRMPQYTKASLIHSVHDMLEPIIRRVSHLGSNLKDLAYMVVVLSSVSPCAFDATAIVEALEDLAVRCKTQLERAGVPLVNDSLEEVAQPTWTPGFDFDAAWTSYPMLSSGFLHIDEMGTNFDPL